DLEGSELARARLSRRVAASLRQIRQARRLVTAEARRLARSGSAYVLDLGPFSDAPAVVRNAALRLAWRWLKAGAGLTARHLSGLEALVRSGRAKGPISLPGGWKASRQGQALQFERPGSQSIANTRPRLSRQPLRAISSRVRSAPPRRS